MVISLAVVFVHVLASWSEAVGGLPPVRGDARLLGWYLVLSYLSCQPGLRSGNGLSMTVKVKVRSEKLMFLSRREVWSYMENKPNSLGHRIGIVYFCRRVLV